MDIYSNAIEARDVAKIEKLNKITSLDHYWDQIRKLTKNVYSDHSLSRWQILAEKREAELKAIEQEKNKSVQSLPEQSVKAKRSFDEVVADAKLKAAEHNQNLNSHKTENKER